VRFSRTIWTPALLCMVVVTAWSVPAAALADIRDVRGNHRFSDRQVRAFLADDDLRGREPGEALRDLQRAYFDEGYLFASFRLEVSPPDSTVTLHIDEGPPVSYGRIRIAGAKLYSEAEIRRMLDIDEGRRYRPSALKEGIDAVLGTYDAAGYPFVQVLVDSLELDHDQGTVDLAMYVVEGGQKELVKVDFEGLRKTRKDIAIKLSGLTPGESYSGRKLREAQVRLSNCGIFNDVAYPTVKLSPDGGGVEAMIRVDEPQRNNDFNMTLGYADREGTKDRVVSGMVLLNLRNIGGSLRDFNVYWRQDGAGRTEMSLGFNQGFVFGRRLEMGIALEQVGLDTVYTWQSLGVETGAPLGRFLGGIFGVDAAVYGDRNTFSEPDTIARTSRLRVLGGFSYTTGTRLRGNFYDATNRVSWAVKRKHRRDGGGSVSVDQLIVDIHHRLAVEFGRALHVTGELSYRSLESDEQLIPLSEQFYIGGAATLRGYRENQFHGRRAAFARSELLLGRSRRENGYVFIDGGYVLAETPTPAGGVLRDNIVRLGYGFGLRTQSRVGNIDISFGVGEKLSLQQTKVHVILNRSF